MTMVTTYDKRRAKSERSRWEVEWCRYCPMYEGTDDLDIDRAEYVAEYFNERTDAEERMREIERLQLDIFGQARMEHQTLEIDFIDEDTGREFWHWTAGDRDGWYIDNGKFYQ